MFMDHDPFGQLVIFRGKGEEGKRLLLLYASTQGCTIGNCRFLLRLTTDWPRLHFSPFRFRFDVRVHAGIQTGELDSAQAVLQALRRNRKIRDAF